MKQNKIFTMKWKMERILIQQIVPGSYPHKCQINVWLFLLKEEK